MKIGFLSRALAGSLCMLSIIGQSQISPQLDPAFGVDGVVLSDFGWQENWRDVFVQPSDQFILAAGTALTPAFAGQLTVARYTPEGDPDPAFNAGAAEGPGYYTITSFTESYAEQILLKSDGKIIIVGSVADPNYVFSMFILQLNPDGTPDLDFGTNGQVVLELGEGSEYAHSAARQTDGKIVISGAKEDANFYNAPVVVRVNENGTLDSAFGSDGLTMLEAVFFDNELNASVVLPNGNIAVAGHFDRGLNAGGGTDFDILLFQLTPDGVLNEAFGDGGITLVAPSGLNIDDAFGLASDSEGRLLVCGWMTLGDFSTDGVLLRFLPNGSLDTSFSSNGWLSVDSGGVDQIMDVLVQADNSILVCGLQTGDMDMEFMIARVLDNGTLDVSFNNTGVSSILVGQGMNDVSAFDIQADGEVVLAGKALGNGNNDFALARFGTGVPDFVNVNGRLEELLVYPVPVNSGGILCVKAPQWDTSTYHITDSAGRIVFSGDSYSDFFQINTSLFSSGIYTLTIANGDKAQAASFVVE
jgi:uncharacterized delta-60 repeat protein